MSNQTLVYEAIHLVLNPVGHLNRLRRGSEYLSLVTGVLRAYRYRRYAIPKDFQRARDE